MTQPPQNPPPCFLVDANCGRLATWLRILGFDTLRPPPLPDSELLRQASAQGRMVLSRDRGLVSSRWVRAGRARAYLVRAEAWREQVREVVAALGLAPLVRPFTRCPACNTPLHPAPLERALGRAPVHVYQTQAQFDECSGCARIYWRGSHHDEMLRLLALLLDRG